MPTGHLLRLLLAVMVLLLHQLLLLLLLLHLQPLWRKRQLRPR